MVAATQLNGRPNFFPTEILTGHRNLATDSGGCEKNYLRQKMPAQHEKPLKAARRDDPHSIFNNRENQWTKLILCQPLKRGS
jgi:hypothetical protein